MSGEKRNVKLMGIINVNGDSFYPASRCGTDEVLSNAVAMAEQGADIIDIGAVSTRPGGELISENEELNALKGLTRALKRELKGVKISVDTFRPSVALAVLNEGADVINDVFGLEYQSKASSLHFGFETARKGDKPNLQKGIETNAESGDKLICIADVCSKFDCKLVLMRHKPLGLGNRYDACFGARVLEAKSNGTKLCCFDRNFNIDGKQIPYYCDDVVAKDALDAIMLKNIVGFKKLSQSTDCFFGENRRYGESQKAETPLGLFDEAVSTLGDCLNALSRYANQAEFDMVCKSLIDESRRAIECGVKRENLILDLGIGFNTTLAEDWLLLLLYPILAQNYRTLLGISRKSFLGGASPQLRLLPTLAATALAVNRGGVDIVRTHDVGLTKAVMGI